MGWCNGCQSIAAIEDLGEAAKAAGGIRSQFKFIRRDTGTIFANLLNVLFPSGREWLGDVLTNINNHAKYIQLAQKRAGQERCLTCASHVVRPYKPTREGGGFKETGDYMYHGQHGTDVEHPGCGGMFYEKAHEMRFSMVFYSRFYTTDGVFIESYFEN